MHSKAQRVHRQTHGDRPHYYHGTYFHPVSLHSVILLSGHLLDGTGAPPISSAAVRIEGDRITYCGPADTIHDMAASHIINLPTHWLLPGLIDVHVHLWGLHAEDRTPPGLATRMTRAKSQANDLLQAGFTTVRDLGSPIAMELRDAITGGRTPGPRIVTACTGLTGANGPWLLPQPA